MKVIVALIALLSTALPAAADSCWSHNGSILRLIAQGQARTWVYEIPRSGLLSAGVRRGTVLFTGTNSGGYYVGTARVFSSACPGAPLEYPVEGPVSHGQTRVTLRGVREVHEACRPTGRVATDTLVFDYAYRC